MTAKAGTETREKISIAEYTDKGKGFDLPDFAKFGNFIPVCNISTPNAYIHFTIFLLILIKNISPGFELYEKVKKIDSKVKAYFITAYHLYYESLKEIYPDFVIL
jgi:hypothetical protein